MTGEPSIDPAAFFREMLGQWEAMANEFGGNMLKSGEFTRVMHGANNAAMKAREVQAGMMERALDAANMPSKADIADLSARIGRIEDMLGRIELMLRAGPQADAAPPPPRARPQRTRKPPTKRAG